MVVLVIISKIKALIIPGIYRCDHTDWMEEGLYRYYKRLSSIAQLWLWDILKDLPAHSLLNASKAHYLAVIGASLISSLEKYNNHCNRNLV